MENNKAIIQQTKDKVQQDHKQELKDELEKTQLELKNKLKEKFKKIITDNRIFYIADKDLYVRYEIETRRWIHYKNSTGLFNFFNINGKEQVNAFREGLAECGHLKEEAVNTFKKTSKYQLNFCSNEHWLKPIKGEVHDVFRLGLKALCGEKQDAQDRLEHTIAYKYLNPWDYKIPMFAFNGEGGVLKNEFLIGTLGVVFGEEQVLSTSCSDALDGFNGEMLGKTVVFFDESKIDKLNYEKLKSLIHNEKMKINVKFGLAGTFDNTPLYFTGSNEISGAVKVGGSSVDRRFSIVTVKRNVMEICADEWGTTYNVKTRSGETVDKWFAEYDQVLRDPVEVAKWLNSIIDKWKNAGRPQPFHSEDYHKLVDIQKTPFEYTAEWIFNRPNFTHICDHDAYIVYKVMTKMKSPATGNRFVSEGVFHAQLEEWLERNCPNVQLYKSVKWRRLDGKSTNRTVYKNHSKSSVKENTSTFLYNDTKDNPHLTEQYEYDNDKVLFKVNDPMEL